MPFQVTPYAAILLTTSLVSAVVVVAAWRRRGAAGGPAFALMMAAVVVWTLSSGLDGAATELSTKILFTKLSFIAAQFVAPLFLVFVLQYSGASDMRSPLLAALMAVIPVVSVALALTNETHHLVWTSHQLAGSPGGLIVVSWYGTWYWISIGYLAVLDILAAVVLVRTMFRAGRVYRVQTVVLLAALAAPWIGEIVSDTALVVGFDTTAVGCAVAGVIIILGLLRYRLLDIVPVARRLVVERMADGLLVLDEKDRVVDANPAARAVFRIDAAAFGQPVERVSGLVHGLLAEAAGQEVFQAERTLTDDSSRQFDLRVSTVRNRDGKPGGRMVVARDVTAHRQAEAERERLIQELRSALADVKTLRGLLPICMNCRKIRDDSGYWKNLEQYVEEHTGAQFSHGLCEDCMRKLYPEYTGSGGRPSPA